MDFSLTSGEFCHTHTHARTHTHTDLELLNSECYKTGKLSEVISKLSEVISDIFYLRKT
jgi:hypothetical protein